VNYKLDTLGIFQGNKSSIALTVFTVLDSAASLITDMAHYGSPLRYLLTSWGTKPALHCSYKWWFVTLDMHNVGVVQQPIQHRCRKCCIAQDYRI
jgi:hypothetical protein